MRLLNDPEWSQWSDREIARRCGVHHELVGRLRSSLAETASETATRTFTTKHGTPAIMDVSRIGRSPRARAAFAPSCRGF
jgi:hypothetical protein